MKKEVKEMMGRAVSMKPRRTQECARIGRIVSAASFWLLVAMGAFAADPTITIDKVAQRYPWNGMVDFQFTITGTAGTKYSTSFAAKDVEANETLPMGTVLKADGTSAAATENLPPGTYNWVWNAQNDVTAYAMKHEGCLGTNSVVVFENVSLSKITEFSGIITGKALDDKTVRLTSQWQKTDGNGISVQFTKADGSYTKSVCVHFEQSGNDVTAYIKWSRYVSGTTSAALDFDSVSYTGQTIATTETSNGYGIRDIAINLDGVKTVFNCERVKVVGTTNTYNPLYMVVDLSAGSSAANYPVSYLEAVPSGGWTDEYKTTKLVLRKVEKGSFKMNGSYNVTLTKDYYIGVFECTQKQYVSIVGSNPMSGYSNVRINDKVPVFYITYPLIRGSSNGAKWPSSNSVDSNSFFGKLRQRTGKSFDLPTEAQWEYACRAGTTSLYCNGGNSDSDLYQVGRCWLYSDGSYGSLVGSYKPNNWGIYDMHGNAREWVLDWYGTLSSGTDPVGPTTGSARTMRGGCFYNTTPSNCSSNARHAGGTDYFTYGFRICCPAE